MNGARASAFGALLLAVVTGPRAISSGGPGARDPRAADPRPVDPRRQLSVMTLTRGHGRQARPGDLLSVVYVGKPPSVSGPPVPSTPGHPEAMEFVLGEGQVIEGWDEGLVGQREGEKRKLVIPAAMAYGARGREGVSPGETLVYEIELASIHGEDHDE